MRFPKVLVLSQFQLISNSTFGACTHHSYPIHHVHQPRQNHHSILHLLQSAQSKVQQSKLFAQHELTASRFSREIHGQSRQLVYDRRYDRRSRYPVTVRPCTATTDSMELGQEHDTHTILRRDSTLRHNSRCFHHNTPPTPDSHPTNMNKMKISRFAIIARVYLWSALLFYTTAKNKEEYLAEKTYTCTWARPKAYWGMLHL